MENLTFGEQVKIMLSRKGMTIKQLARLIEERTGKAMSRQNLTQRLGRDNFQEQDMRLIAAILGCPFYLSIFPMEGSEDAQVVEDAAVKYANQAKLKDREPEKVIAQQPMAEPVKAVKNQPAGEERDMTIGELYEIHEELDELEETVKAGEPVTEGDVQSAVEEAVMDAEEAEAEIPMQESSGITAETPKEAGEEAYSEDGISADTIMDTTEGEELSEGQAESPDESVSAEENAIPQSEPETAYGVPEGQPVVAETEAAPAREPRQEDHARKKDRFRSGGIFLRRKNVSRQEEVKAETPAEEKKTQSPITPDSDDFEPVIKHEDVKEDLLVGELNPYTGHEYQSNSVRMHPNRIGYVQVYDRTQHKWTDMTEWAFLGYQERKKALLGKDYEPPIYLD